MQEQGANAQGAGGGALVAELAELERQFLAVTEDAARLVENLTDAQFNWRAAPGSWSIGECLAHLNLTGQMMLAQIDRAVQEARARGLYGRGPFRHGLFGKLFIRANEPPAKIKVKAPKVFAPPPEHLPAVVVPAFMSLQEQFLRRVRDANGLDLDRVKVTSPVTKLIRLNLGEALSLAAAHERRHLWQARRVKEEANFPRA